MQSSGQANVTDSFVTRKQIERSEPLGASRLSRRLIKVSNNEWQIKRKVTSGNNDITEDTDLIVVDLGSPAAGRKSALLITVFATGEKSGISSNRIFNGQWSAIRDNTQITIENRYSMGNSGMISVIEQDDSLIKVRASFAVVSGGSIYASIKSFSAGAGGNTEEITSVFFPDD